MLNREKAIEFYDIYLTMAGQLRDAGYPVFCYFSTEYDHNGRIQFYTVNELDIPVIVATVYCDVSGIYLKTSYPAWCEDDWLRLKELLTKKLKLDVETLSVMTEVENQDTRIKVEYKVSKL